MKKMIFTQIIICLLAVSSCTDNSANTLPHTLPHWVARYSNYRDSLCLPSVDSNWIVVPVWNDISIPVDSLYNSNTGDGRCILYYPNVRFERANLLDSYLHGSYSKGFLFEYPELQKTVDYLNLAIRLPSFYSRGYFVLSPTGGFHAKKTFSVKNNKPHIEFDEFIHKSDDGLKFLTLLFFYDIADNEDYWKKLRSILRYSRSIYFDQNHTEKNGHIDFDKYIKLLYRGVGPKNYNELVDKTLWGRARSLSDIDSIFTTWYLHPNEITQMNATCNSNLEKESYREDIFAKNGLLDIYLVVKEIRPYYAKYIEEVPNDKFRVISLTQADSILCNWGINY